MTQLAVRAPAAAVSAVLPPEFAAVQAARELVRTALPGWHADEICDDVALVVSELVANALMHGLMLPVDGGRSGLRPGQVELQLVSTGSHLICTVRDPSPLPPVRRPAHDADLGGRGLQLIESLSLCWGWTPASGAKSVWAVFGLAPAPDPVRPPTMMPEPLMSLRAG